MANVFYIVLPDCRSNPNRAVGAGLYIRDLPDSSLLSTVAKEVQKLFFLFRAEEGVEFYYSKGAIDELRQYAEEFDEYPHQPVLQLITNAIIMLGAVDYHKSPMYSDDLDFCYRACYDKGEIVAIAANHAISANCSVLNVALINAHALVISDNIINFSISCNHADMHTINCMMLDVKEIALYMVCNRKPSRVFFPSDKHGVNMPEDANLGGASPLMCSEEDAQKYLQYGFSDRERRVWTYDKSRGKFITFEKQADNVWHGYHLIKAKDVEREKMPSWVVTLLKSIAPTV